MNQYTPLERADVIQEVKTSGKIASMDSHNVTAVGEGKIMQVNVKEGDIVSKGQTLAVLDSSSINQEMEEARKTYKQELKQIKGEMETAKSDLEIAKFNYETGDIAKIDLDKAKKAYESAQSLSLIHILSGRGGRLLRLSVDAGRRSQSICAAGGQ